MDYGNEHAKAAAASVGLQNGRMISSSKSAYRRAHPDRLPVFNATITDSEGVCLWWGDLDLSVDEPKLVAMACELGTSLRVFHEGASNSVDAERESFDPEAASFVVDPGGGVEVPEREAGYITRDAAGRLVARRP